MGDAARRTAELTVVLTVAADAATLGRAAFLARYPFPVLVAIGWRRTAWAGGAYDSTARPTPVVGPVTAPLDADAPVWSIPDPDAVHGTVRVGRAPGNDIVIPEPSISKWHVELCFDGRLWFARDAGSRNGTWIEGAKVPTEVPIPIRSGDTLTLGTDVRLRFLTPDALFEQCVMPRR